MKLTLIATTAMGLESELSYEAKKIGLEDVKTFNGKIEFSGDLIDICRANIWLRTAGRVLIKIGEFKATTFDELFEKTKALNWGEWIKKNDQFPVNKISSRKSVLFSKSDSQAIVKKAVVDSLKAYHKSSYFPEQEAMFPIRVQIENDVVTLSIDTSGTGLNKRGYRAERDIAPLRETMAAGLVMLSRWKPESGALLDPLCGTATILIEAALMAKNIAPGLNREFVSQDWKVLPKHFWHEVKAEAKSQIIHNVTYQIFGSDINARALDIAKHNVKLSGLSNIVLEKKAFKDILPPAAKGVIITNPPYGERLNDVDEAEMLYKEMGEVFNQYFPTWSYNVLTPNEKFEKIFGYPASKNRKLFNGNIGCRYYQYYNR